MLALLDKIAQHPKYHQFFNLAHMLSLVFFFCAVLGIASDDFKFLPKFDLFMKMCIAIFLTVRFNPMAKRAINKESATFDKEVAFSAGIILLTSCITDLWPKIMAIVHLPRS